MYQKMTFYENVWLGEIIVSIDMTSLISNTLSSSLCKKPTREFSLKSLREDQDSTFKTNIAK